MLGGENVKPPLRLAEAVSVTEKDEEPVPLPLPTPRRALAVPMPKLLLPVGEALSPRTVEDMEGESVGVAVGERWAEGVVEGEEEAELQPDEVALRDGGAGVGVGVPREGVGVLPSTGDEVPR